MTLRARAFPVVIAAPSGAGKTSLARALVERNADVVFSVSATTRPPRELEVNGVHPIGLSLDAHIAAAELDDEYRSARARLDAFEQVARLLIRYRIDHGLSQTQLAERAGVSHSVVSRIETGQHRTNLDTLARMARSLGRRLAISFEPLP